ncbi:MAG: hypothetical protein ACE361_20645 [Aureliella sp.]
MELDVALGERVAGAIQNSDYSVAYSLMQEGNFIVFQQIDPENPVREGDDPDNFPVVLAEVDDDLAVVCFSDEEAAQHFADEVVGEELPEGHELPAMMLTGEALIEGLPADCGLLLNAGAESECYFPPGAFENDEEE